MTQGRRVQSVNGYGTEGTVSVVSQRQCLMYTPQCSLVHPERLNDEGVSCVLRSCLTDGNTQNVQFQRPFWTYLQLHPVHTLVHTSPSVDRGEDRLDPTPPERRVRGRPRWCTLSGPWVRAIGPQHPSGLQTQGWGQRVPVPGCPPGLDRVLLTLPLVGKNITSTIKKE